MEEREKWKDKMQNMWVTGHRISNLKNDDSYKWPVRKYSIEFYNRDFGVSYKILE